MNKYLIVLISILTSVCLINCKSVVPPPPPPVAVQKTPRNFKPLTYSLLKEIEKQAARDGKTIADIKFYLSGDVKLVRAENGTTLEIDTSTDSEYGTVYRSRVQNYETIIIPRNSGGFYIDENPYQASNNNNKIILGISFDPNNTNLLHFTQNGINGEDYFYLETSGAASNLMVSYGGKNYFAISNGNETPFLMIQFIDRAVSPDDYVKRIPGRQVKPQKDGAERNSEITLGE